MSYRLMIFGTGKYCDRLLKHIPIEDIVCFADNNISIQGNEKEGKPIISPQRINEYKYDYIVLASIYWADMIRQLKEMHISYDKMVIYSNIERLYHLKDSKLYCSPQRTGSGQVLMVAYDMNRNGAGRAFAELGKSIVTNGFEVDFVSREDGPLREELVDVGMNVLINSEILCRKKDFCDLASKYSFVFVNTLQNYEEVLYLTDSKIQCVWWIHEPEYMYEDYAGVIPQITGDNIHRYAVSNIAINTYNKYFPGSLIKKFVPGMCDSGMEIEKGTDENDSAVIGVIAHICKIKGQELLLKAIELLPPGIKNSIIVKFIGNDADALEVIAECKNNNNIVFTGELPANKIYQMMQNNELNVIVVPSEIETLSLAAVEGLMYSKCVIVSGTTGIAEYIENYKNGIVFDRNNITELVEAIEWVTKKDNRERMEREGRKLFERCFSKESLDYRTRELLCELGEAFE